MSDILNIKIKKSVNNTITIQYSQSVTHVGLTIEEAKNMGHALIKTALEMQGIISDNVQ